MSTPSFPSRPGTWSPGVWLRWIYRAATLGALASVGCLPGDGYIVHLGATVGSAEWEFELPEGPFAVRLSYQIADHTFLTQEETSRFRIFGPVDPDGPEGPEPVQEEQIAEILVGGCSEGCWVETIDEAVSLPGPHRVEWWSSPADSSPPHLSQIQAEFFFPEPSPVEE